jgi:hypothetical protein
MKRLAVSTRDSIPSGVEIGSVQGRREVIEHGYEGHAS